MLRTRILRARDAAGLPDDPSSSQPRLSPDARRALFFAGIGVAAYLLALLATIPAAFVIPRGSAIAGLGGTAWQGQAALVGGDRLSWRWAPLATLANLGFAADFNVDGAGTALAGRAVLRSRGVRLDNVSGSADARLLGVAAPKLGFTCAMPLRLDLKRISVGGSSQSIEGTALSDAGTCQPRSGGAAMPVPPLAFSAEHVGDASTGSIAPAGQRRQKLVDFRLTEPGHLTLTVTREGAAVMPFTGPAAGFTIETDL